MKKLTFCTFAANDEGDIQTPVNLFLKSLLSQDTSESCVLFFDLSPVERQLKLPEHPDLEVVRTPITDYHQWNRSMFRNQLALRAKTEMICQCCADCYYSPNFASTLIRCMGEGNKLLLCRRRRAEQVDSNKIVANNNLVFELGPKLAKDSQAPCGECQCMIRQQFIDIGGYYRLIVDGKSTYGDWGSTAGKDDTNLLWCIRKVHGYEREKHNIQEVWIDDEPNIWLIHLWHPERTNAKKWVGR